MTLLFYYKFCTGLSKRKLCFICDKICVHNYIRVILHYKYNSYFFSSYTYILGYYKIYIELLQWHKYKLFERDYQIPRPKWIWFDKSFDFWVMIDGVCVYLVFLFIHILIYSYSIFHQKNNNCNALYTICFVFVFYKNWYLSIVFIHISDWEVVEIHNIYDLFITKITKLHIYWLKCML